MGKKSSHERASGRQREKGAENNKMAKCENAKIEWYANFALFGDSLFALCSSFTLLILSVLILHMDGNLKFPRWGPSPNERAYQKLGPVPDIAPPRIFHLVNKSDNLVSYEMQESFDRDGVICVRGLLDPDLINLIDDETTKIILHEREKIEAKDKSKRSHGKAPKQFFTVNQGVIFSPVDGNSNSDTSPFVKLAILSKIPEFVANLLNFDCDKGTNETLRILRDIFLAKDEEEYVCGWHVDDIGFWPALVEEPKEPVGINAWIALDDMPVEGGGGFALAVGSHTASWRHEAYNLTGSTHSFPKDGGFKSSRDVLRNRSGNGTCNIQHTAPYLHRRMEETKRVYEIKRGDVIFHTRWLFHKTIPFDRNAVSERLMKKEDPALYRRYSIRYGPGSSVIPPGYGTEPSVISDEKNGGRTADEVSQYDSAWYPRVWPSISGPELEQMKVLAEERLPAAMEISAYRKRVTRPRIKQNS